MRATSTPPNDCSTNGASRPTSRRSSGRSTRAAGQLLKAGRGAAKDARRWGKRDDRARSGTGSEWDELHARHALGIAALIESAPDRALEELCAVWEHCEREGVLEPGAFPVAPDLVETLVELERFDEALAIAAG